MPSTNREKLLIKQDFGANALHSGLSPDGRFATYMTAGGDNPDASKLTLFNLDDRETSGRDGLNPDDLMLMNLSLLKRCFGFCMKVRAGSGTP